MTNHIAHQNSTRARPLFEKSSNGFAEFVMPLRVTISPRGDLIALIKTLINARACPPINGWADVYRLLARRDASEETILEARKLWNEFRKSQPAPSPGHNRRAAHG